MFSFTKNTYLMHIATDFSQSTTLAPSLQNTYNIVPGTFDSFTEVFFYERLNVLSVLHHHSELIKIVFILFLTLE